MYQCHISVLLVVQDSKAIFIGWRVLPTANFAHASAMHALLKRSDLKSVPTKLRELANT